ncbi:MAG: Ty1/Copia family ribonuclease HI, partial [Bacteroidota bacterium]
TFKVLTASNKVVNTRYVRAAQSGELNWRVEAPKGEEIEYIKSTHELRMKRIYDYVRKNPKSAVRFRTHKPDFFNFEYKEYDWAYSVYGNVREQIPENLDDPLGKSVIVWAYTDANLYHDYVTGRATTGIILFINGTPVEWMSKRQRVTETATYGSEFTAARICTDLTVSVRQELRYFGVPVEKVSYMFGDNKSVITSSTIPHSSLNKQHNALNYHCVREAVVSGFLWFIHVVSPENVSDVLSKHCGFQEFWPHIQPILFWKGDTMDCPQPKRTPKQKGPSLEELYFT